LVRKEYEFFRKGFQVMSLTRKIYLLFTAILCIQAFLSSAAYAESPKEVTISAAMSLKTAFEELWKHYEAAHKGVRIMFNFGASGDLMRQIEGGAPVDAFASASKKEMGELEKKGLVIPGSRVDFASNNVVLVMPSHSKIRIKSFADLGSKEIKKIAMGDPKTVPAGRYAWEALEYYKIIPGIKEKLIFAENVRQVLDYVARGEVDAGLVYSTDVMTRAREVTVAATASAASHEPILYPFALIKGTKNEGPAKEFISLVISAEGTKILRKYGFLPVQKKKTSR
jgi:molybdate transport system substrate-binding protein